MVWFLYFFVIFHSILSSVILSEIFHVFLGCQGSICSPKWVSLGLPGASFWSYFVDAVLGWGPACAVGAKKYHVGFILEVILSPLTPFWVLWGDILGTVFVCMMFCWFSFQDCFLRYVTRHSIVFREIFLYRAIVSYAVALILVSLVVLVFISVCV